MAGENFVMTQSCCSQILKFQFYLRLTVMSIISQAVNTFTFTKNVLWSIDEHRKVEITWQFANP